MNSEIMHKTYTLPFVGIVYKDYTIPKDSVGTVGDCYYGDDTQIIMHWNMPNKETITVKFGDDFFDLVKNKILVDISTLKRPKTKPLFQEGDLVKLKVGNGYYGIITGSKYDYSNNQWMYIMSEYYTYKKFQADEWYYDENQLKKVDEVKFDISNNGRKIEMIIKEVK